MPQQVKREETLTVKEIWEEFGRKISLRQIYNLIERGDLAPAYRFAGKYGTCVPRAVVEEYRERCLISVGV